MYRINLKADDNSRCQTFSEEPVARLDVASRARAKEPSNMRTATYGR